MIQLFKRRKHDSLKTSIDKVVSEYTNFSDSYQARKILYDMGFTMNFIEDLYDYGYFSTEEFDKWFKKYDKVIVKDSKIYNLLKTTYYGGVENFKMNQEFDKMIKFKERNIFVD